MYTLDDIDRKMLRLLQQNAKYTTKELAAHLGLTTTPVHERLKRLERDGFITGYVALLDPKKVDQGMLAFCEVSLNQHSHDYLKAFEAAVKPMEEVVALHHMAGRFDYLLKVIVKDMNEYQLFVNERLSRVTGIRQVQTSFVLNEVKNTTAIPLPRKGK